MSRKDVYIIVNDGEPGNYTCYQCEVKKSAAGTVKEFYSAVLNSTTNNISTNIKLSSGVTATDLIRRYNGELNSRIIYLGEILKLYDIEVAINSCEKDPAKLKVIKQDQGVVGPINGFLNMFNIKKKIIPSEEVHKYILSQNLGTNINEVIKNIGINTEILDFFNTNIKDKIKHKGYVKAKTKEIGKQKK